MAENQKGRDGRGRRGRASALVICRPGENRKVLEQVLAEAGWEVELVDTPDGERLSREPWPFGLVFLDVGLVETEAKDLLARLRDSDSPERAFAVALLLEEDQSEVEADGLRELFDDFIFFPAGRRELSLRLRAFRGHSRCLEELKSTQRQLRNAQRIAECGSWELDLEQDSLWWSEEVYRIFGVSAEEFGETFEAFFERVHPEDREKLMEQQRTALEEEKGEIDVEHRIVRPDGEVRHVRERGRLVHDAWTGARFLAGTVQDVTARKQASDRIRDLATRLRDSLESMTDGFLTLDRRWRCTFVNPEAERLLEQSEDELLGESVLSGECDISGTLYEDKFEEAFVKRRTVSFEARHPQLKKWFDVRAYPMEEGIAVYFRDATEERRAREQVKLLEACLARMNDVVMITEGDPIDPPGPRITYVNDAFEWTTGFSREEAIGQTPRILQGPETSRKELDRIRQAMERREAIRVDLANYKKSGEPYRVEIEISPLIDEKGQLTHFVAVQRDITERAMAEEAVRESERTLASLISQLPGFVFLLDKEGKMERWNRRVEKILGYSHDEIKDLTAFQLLAEADRELARDRIEEAMTTGTAQAELRTPSRDGSERLHLFTASRIRLQGEDHLLGVGIDIEELREAEQRIREQAELLDKARDAIIVTDLDQRILYCNKSAERLHGFAAEEVLGQREPEVFGQDREEFRAAMEELLERDEWSGVMTHHSRQGREFIGENRWTLIRDESGKAQRILMIITDVTEQKKLEQQFLRAQRMESIGTLAGGIAHDLNNVLAPIIMSVDLLRLSVKDERDRETLSTIERTARRGADLVRQVLSFARGFEGDRIGVQMRHVLLEIEKIVSETFPRKIEFSRDFDRDLWMVTGDPTQLHQVLINLCVNARDAMPGGGKLMVRARNVELERASLVGEAGGQKGRFVCIEVEDTGTGMSEEVLARIYDPFFTTKEVGQGTGLGLSTTLTIVESHGGYLEVESEVGRGTRFRVYLPAQDEHRTRQEDAEREDGLPRGQGETILLVDDEAPIREVASKTLAAFGYEVLTARNGVEAITQFAQQNPRIDLVVMDMMMPVLDGWEAIKALVEIDENVAILAASGIESQLEAAAKQFPAVKGTLAKPFSVEALLGGIRSMLAEEGGSGRGEETDSWPSRRAKPEENGGPSRGRES